VQKFLQLVLSGTVTGAIYSLMASGIVLTYQTSGIFDFAHGAIAFSVAFFYYQLNTGQGVHPALAAIISIFVFAPLLGLLLDRILLRRLAAAPVYARIVGTIGLLVALPKLMLWIFEDVGDTVLGFDFARQIDIQQRGVSAPGLLGKFREVVRFDWIGLDRVNLSTDQLAVFASAALAAGVLWYVVKHTRVGLEMRASVDRGSLASLRGVNQAHTSAVAWILTMMLAGLGGILISPLFLLNDDLFTLVVLGSLAAVALAAIRGFDPQSVSIPIAFAGGLLLGIVQNLSYGYRTDIFPGFVNDLSGFRSSIPYLMTLIILLVTTARTRGRQAGTAADEVAPRDHRVGVPSWRRRLPWVLVTLAIVAFTFQWIDVSELQADSFEQSIIAQGLVLSIIFLSFVVVTGLGGMVSLSQATFVTAGAFAAGWALNRSWGSIPILAPHGRMNFAVAVLVAPLAAAALGALIAVPVSRLGAVALALATFAFAFVLDLVAFGYEPIGKGSFGWSYTGDLINFPRDLPSLDFAPLNWFIDLIMPGDQPRLDLSNPAQQVLVLLALFGLVTLMIHGLVRSTSGRSMLAARSSDVGARTSGINPTRQKVLIFALSAAIAGFGGAMSGMVNGVATKTQAPPLIGLVWLAVAVTFGVRRPGGALLAGLAFVGTSTIFTWIGNDFLTGAFRDLTTSIYFVPILFGLGAINLAKNPDGLLALIGHQRLEKRLAKERRTAVELAETAVHGGVLPEHERLVGAIAAGDEAEPSTRPDAALSLQGIVAGYGEVEVLHGVDVDIPTGRAVALLGANGAGKSTLCAVAAGLLAPISGRVLIEGVDVTEHPAYRRQRDGILLVPEARGIFPGLSVEENLSILLASASQRTKAYERFPILGERRKQFAGSLSGGEQQMLSLAPALAQPPKVFVADEPTLGLAPLAAEDVVRALHELRDLGSAILLVDEKAREAMDLADEVAFLELGNVVWRGARDDVDEELLAASYLGGHTD
jgi:ABC-type branched-subunit amino acid transport system ATPase component/branched-subunit amino acid ABC-type transport system permease component